jgi:NitT/TauT family transport system substrate-binding protein
MNPARMMIDLYELFADCPRCCGGARLHCCTVIHYMMAAGGTPMSHAFRAALCALLLAAPGLAAAGEIQELKIPKGAGGIGFLPLLVMEQQKTVEKHAAQLGHKNLSVTFVNIGGPAVVNDALLSGAAQVVAAGPPAFLLTWDRTRESTQIMGVAAMSSLPMYLNTTNPKIKALRDVTEKDKMAVTAVKVSIPAIIMQMAARKEFGDKETFRYDRYTVGLPHPDGVAAMLSGISEINLHFTSPPFVARELKDPRVRTILSTDDVMGGSTTFTMLYTTKKFRDENPVTYKAIVRGLKDAIDYINRDKRGAAQVYFDSIGGKGETIEEIMTTLSDPKNVLTMVPQNTLKYAQFMHEIGSLKNKAASWKDFFFPEVHDLAGN